MAIIDKKISTLIPQQFTEFFRQERSDIVDFVQKYYEFLESVQINFVDTVYNEPFLLTENGDTLIYDKTLRETAVLESDRNFGTINKYVDHFDKGEIITGLTSNAQFYVTSRVRRYKLEGIYHRMPDGTEMKDSIHPYDSVFGYYLNDNYFLEGETLVGGTTRVQSTYLNSNRNPLNVSRDIENSFNIDFAEFTYVNKFYDEIAPYIPKDLSFDKNLLLKHIKDLYVSRGNEDSFRFLFNLIFPDANLEFYYPKEDMLRVSDGNWIVETAIRINLNDVINRDFFVDSLITGQTSGATAYISSIRNVGPVGLQSLEILIKNIIGTFLIGETILGYNSDEEISFGGKLEGILSSLTINNPGKNYEIGDIITVTGGTSSDGRARITSLKDGVVDTIQVIDPGDGYFVGDQVIFDNSLSGGDGGVARVSAIVPTHDFKSINEKINDLKLTKLNQVDFLSVFFDHDVNTHLLSDTTNTFKVTFDPAISGTLLKHGDFISVDGSSNSISATIINGDGSETSITGANTCLIAIRGLATSDDFVGENITAWDNITGRTSNEINNSIELVLSGATGTISELTEVSENPDPFGDLEGSGDTSGNQYFGALTYETIPIGGILAVDVTSGGTDYIEDPIVSIVNEETRSYNNDLDSVGQLTKVLKFNSNLGLNFTPNNKVKGSLALSIGDTGDEFEELEEIRGLTSDALGLYVKSLGSSSEFNLHSSQDTFLVTQLPTWFLSFTQDSASGTIAHSDIITGDDSGATAYVLYNVTDSGVTGQAPDHGSTDIVRILPLEGRFIRNETITTNSGVVAELLDSVNFLDGPHVYDFVYGETLLGLDTAIERTVVTPSDINDPVFIDPPVGLIIGPITDTSNTTYSEIRILETIGTMSFDNDHYLIEYRNTLNPFFDAAQGQLMSTSSSEVDTRLKGNFTARLEVDEITSGAISSIEIFDFGQGFTTQVEPTVLIGSDQGTGASLFPTITPLASYPGRYVGDRGLISGQSKIQDSYFYQSFSYVLRTEVNLAGTDAYRNVIKKLLHPAGLAAFAEVLLISDLNVASIISSEIGALLSLFQNVNLQINTDSEHEISIFSSGTPFALNLRVKNDFPDYDTLIAEDWDVRETNSELVLRSFNLDLFLVYEDGDNILFEARDKRYLLPEIMFPDMQPFDISISFILEDEGSDPYQRQITNLVYEDSTIEIPINIIAEQYDKGDVTIDVGPEPREIFDWNTEIEIDTLLNVEVDRDYESEIEIDLPSYRAPANYANTDWFIEIHQKEFKEVNGNNQILVNVLPPPPEIQFNNFYGHIPLSDGPISNWELETIVDSYTDLKESAFLVQEDYFRDYIVSENNNSYTLPSSISGFEIEGERFITENDFYLTTEQSYLEQKSSISSYDLLTEDGDYFVTNNLLSAIYDDVQIFYGLRLFKGRETPDIYRNLLEEDWRKNSRVSRITTLGTFVEGIEYRHIPISLNYNISNYEVSTLVKNLFVNPSAVTLGVTAIKTIEFDFYPPNANVTYNFFAADTIKKQSESFIFISNLENEQASINQWFLFTDSVKKIDIISFREFSSVGYRRSNVSKDFVSGDSSLQDGEIQTSLPYNIKFYLPLEIPNGLRMFDGNSLLENQFDLYSRDFVSGTCTFINNSKTVQGLNSLFTTEISVGDSIIVKETINNEAQKFIVSSITDDTHLEINVPFTGSYDDKIFKEIAI